MSRVRKLADLAALDTEAVRPELSELDIQSVPDLVALMTSESIRASEAVAAVTQRLVDGGRLIYVGAGTAGRLGVLDAAEAGPTFDVPSGRVIGLVAGGPDAMLRAQEGAEDDSDAGTVQLRALGC